jgi:serine/threonine protein kinase
VIDISDPTNMGAQSGPPVPAANPAPVLATADAAALPAGHKVFEYRIEKMLGGGGFGLTYLAQDINLQLPVALKVYYPGDLATRSADSSVHVRAAEGAAQFNWGLERFLDEARALASFRHPNITRVLRYFKENGTAYIVMEYETGDPLKRWLAGKTGLSQQGLLDVIFPLMDGLEQVHKLNFLHRDIKPDNIYIRADGSPVLLDFGAARRVTADRDMTNIISPGFAPFEQYHSQGNQGPWTDIYSLGAVMYWMTTGNKPLESASRVKQDSMPSALVAGQRGFGETLLKAIDWALSPDEGKRPQSVAEFRAALLGSQDARTRTIAEPRPGSDQDKTNSDVLAFAASSQSIPQAQSDSLRKNVLGTIMFLDLVAYSTYSMEQQVAVKARFNELITKALKGVVESSRIVIDTGDGAAVCFLGDPEEALQSALLLRSLLVQKYGQSLSVRIGLHLGPIRMVFDINNRVNVVGDGINVAQRIMDFAQANQIVVSRAYYDVVSRITDMAASLFSPLGPHLDKHLRSHDIYAVLDPQQAQQAPASTHAFEDTASFEAATLTPEHAAEIESELARLIGPLARVLVKKAMSRAISAQGLRDLLAVSIPDPAAREVFAKVKSSASQAGNSFSRPASGPSSRSGAPVSSSSRLAPDESRPSQPSRLSPDFSRPSQPGQLGRDITRPNSTSLPLQNLTQEQLLQLEKVFSQYIGPMARMIIKKEAARHATMGTLLPALALHIDRTEDRPKFLAFLQKMANGPR